MPCDGRGDIVKAVLLIEHDRGEALARDHFGDNRGGERAPGRVNGLARAQAAGEGKA